MIHIDQASCAGCGVCIDACPTGAITLVDGVADVDAALCDGCASWGANDAKLCVAACPNGALAWVAQPVSDVAPSSALVPHQPDLPIIDVTPPRPASWRQAILPVVGGALAWVGRELVPRFTPLALDALASALERRSATPSTEGEVLSLRTGPGLTRGRRRRLRRRGHPGPDRE